MLSFFIYSSIYRKEETMSRTEKRAEYDNGIQMAANTIICIPSGRIYYG